MSGASARKNPFAVGGSEAAGSAGGFAGTILAWQNRFHIELQNAARRVKTDSAAFWSLVAASFAYGVFHAAGPGHGKAVLASYMIASRSAVRRGMILAGLASLGAGWYGRRRLRKQKEEAAAGESTTPTAETGTPDATSNPTV